jgi:hypothetical protein
LVVADGSLSFGTSGFGLSDFIDTLKSSSIHGMTPIVKTAHRGATSADFTNFTFTSSSLSISKYDVVFLFGFNSSGALPTAEVNVISSFMDAGGGVFATGDHETLGKQLSGDIPRVRAMRAWNGPSASGTDRISTNDPGANNQFEFEDQSDTIPQKIYPAYTGTPLASAPHYLLQHPTKKVIEVLPDHPHESECLVPGSLSDTTEWPKDAANNTVSPELVALSVTYGGGFTSPTKQPISAPRAFGAIGAYDGHRANVGRISVDATWHHFININLIATSDGLGLVANPDAYDRVSTYFSNIAKWLMPKKTRKCLRWPLVVIASKLYPIVEFLPPFPPVGPPTLDEIIELGGQMRATLARFLTPGERSELVGDILDAFWPELTHFLSQAASPAKDVSDVVGARVIVRDIIEQAALGAVSLSVAEALPAGSDLESRFKELGGMDGLERKAKEQLTAAFKELRSMLGKGRSQLDALIELC